MDGVYRICDGSSPRLRGAPSLPCRAPLRPGIIPAFAGSTRTRVSLPLSRTDHPRVRGEHSAMERLLLLADGSSPRSRGARRASKSPPRSGRIIPAFAGSTTAACAAARCSADHPRVRGGARTMRVADDRSGRIIPAFAGSTLVDLGRCYRIKQFSFGLFPGDVVERSAVSGLTGRYGARLRSGGLSPLALLH